MATSTEPLIVYDKRELASFAKVIKNMSETAVEETKRRVGELAQKELNEIRRVAASRGKVADRVAQGGKVKKSSVLGEISFGFAEQKFSGGATTQFNTRNDPKGKRKGIGAAAEFGSSKYPQFPRWSGPMPKGPGSRGWFIYPTIRHLQPTIIKEFEEIILDIKKEFSDGK
jgi:predicted TIM-barrel fold metal-dependent hydrolase